MHHDDDVWTGLSALLPGLRRPAPGRVRDRRDVHALVARIEADVSRDVSRAFHWDASGLARLSAAESTWRAGRFTLPTLGALEARVRERRASGTVTFSVVRGDHPLTDVGALQAMAGPGTLFQVASQFNCLEAPGPSMVRVADYVFDNTQGPRASVSAFPGTLLRHYAAPAPDGTRFTQTGATHINLLDQVCSDRLARVQSGYLSADGVPDPPALERALEAGFDRIRVGVHDDVDVVLGANWGGPVAADAPTIAQVFTSTMALGSYSRSAGDELTGVCRWLLRGAYLGTLLAALDLRKQAVVLTLIGGGAFGNPLREIWNAMLWAVDRVTPIAPSDLAVVLNARTMPSGVPPDEVVRATRDRHGVVLNSSIT